MPAMSMGADLDLSGFYLINARPESVPSLPASGMNGRLVVLTTDGRLYFGAGGAWHPIGTDLIAFEGETPASLRDRGTHTGTQDVSTIENLNQAVRSNRLDQLAAPQGPVSMNSQRLTGVGNGTASNDAVNRSQLDAVAAMAADAASNVATRMPVRLVTTANDSLSGLAARDGVTPVAGDRILVTGQTTASANGIYIAASGAWARAADADQNGELVPGTTVAVNEGTANADTRWAIYSDAPITIGTTAQTWTKIPSGSGGEILSAGAGLSKTGTTMSAITPGGSGIIIDGTGIRINTTVVARKFSGPVPAGTTPTVTHNLNTEDIEVTVKRVSDGQQVLMPWSNLGMANGVNLLPGAAVTAGQYRVTVMG